MSPTTDDRGGMRRPFKLGLLGKFALASAVPLLVLGLVLGKYLAHRVEQRTLAQAEQSAGLIARVGFQSQITAQELQRGKLSARPASGAGRGADEEAPGGRPRAHQDLEPQRQGRLLRRSEADRDALPDLRPAPGGAVAARPSPGLELHGREQRERPPARQGARGLRTARADPGRAGRAARSTSSSPYEPIAREIRHETRTMYLLLLAGIGLVWRGPLPHRCRRVAPRCATRPRRSSTTPQRRSTRRSTTRSRSCRTASLFAERIQYALYDAHEEGSETAVLLMDLDRFKEINDTLGHHCGDLLLQELGARLKSALRDSDTVARLGGDEFGVLLPSIPDRRVVNEVVERIRDRGRGAVQPAGPAARDRDLYRRQHLPRARRGRRHAHAAGRRRHVPGEVERTRSSRSTTPPATSTTPSRLTLVGELRRAIDEQRARSSTTSRRRSSATATSRASRRSCAGSTRSAACSRRTSSSRSPSTPGLIGPLTIYVLDHAMAQLPRLARRGHEPDASPSTWRCATCSTSASRTRSRSCSASGGSSPTSLELEITENTIMADPFRAMSVLGRLNEMGVKLSIDDFGTGYSSLAYLKRLPVDAVKIDKSFVLGMIDGRERRRHRPLDDRPRPQPRPRRRRRGRRDRARSGRSSAISAATSPRATW